MIDPEYSFGAPTVRGIRTEVIAELADVGEPVEEVADDYSLSPADVKAAVAFERRLVA